MPRNPTIAIVSRSRPPTGGPARPSFPPKTVPGTTKSFIGSGGQGQAPPTWRETLTPCVAP